MRPNCYNPGMSEKSDDIQKRITELEEAMLAPDFWSDKTRAQGAIKELGELKDRLEGVGAFDKVPAMVTIFSGAGGDDAEDFSAMLFGMYQKYADAKGWATTRISETRNDHGGYRNVTFEVEGKGSYGLLKNESGVHRLVRISPFNAGGKRQTSFSLVEVVPKLPPSAGIVLNPDDLDMQFIRSSGPGGQNVNKRETAVRIVHKPSGIAVHVDTERSQQQNKERGLELIKGKLFKKMEDDRKKSEKGLSISATTAIEWGSQIRSYVLHPYKLVKDHRTDVEVHDAEGVLEGNLDKFIEAEKDLDI